VISALRMCKIVQVFRKRFPCPLQTVPVRSKEKMIGGDADVRHKSANKVIKILFAFLSDISYICIELFDRMNLDVSLFKTCVSKSLPHKKTTP
ncbi:hypothetical protein, partial [Alistipes putredinis]|uniref:hypothetical protein n=1 Tax=Alistipes putredinis TaxID=28117 RepID=UPI003AB69DCE